jgi:hypothetical protein
MPMADNVMGLLLSLVTSFCTACFSSLFAIVGGLKSWVLIDGSPLAVREEIESCTCVVGWREGLSPTIEKGLTPMFGPGSAGVLWLDNASSPFPCLKRLGVGIMNLA